MHNETAHSRIATTATTATTSQPPTTSGTVDEQQTAAIDSQPARGAQQASKERSHSHTWSINGVGEAGAQMQSASSTVPAAAVDAGSAADQIAQRRVTQTDEMRRLTSRFPALCFRLQFFVPSSPTALHPPSLPLLRVELIPSSLLLLLDSPRVHGLSPPSPRSRRSRTRSSR